MRSKTRRPAVGDKAKIAILEDTVKRLEAAYAERDELAKAFAVAYDELEDFYCSWCRRQSAMPKEVQSFAGLRERLRKGGQR